MLTYLILSCTFKTVLVHTNSACMCLVTKKRLSTKSPTKMYMLSINSSGNLAKR